MGSLAKLGSLSNFLDAKTGVNVAEHPKIEKKQGFSHSHPFCFYSSIEISVSADNSFVAPNNFINGRYNVDAFNDVRNVLTSFNDTLSIANLMLQLHVQMYFA